MAKRREQDGRRTPRQARAQAMVDAILHAGAQVFREAGFERASTNLIAQVAGVSVGSLYQYFPNKEAIAAALVTRIEAELLERLRAIASSEHPDVHAVIDALIDAVIDVHERHPHLVCLYLTSRELMHDDSLADADALVAGLLARFRDDLDLDVDADVNDVSWVLVRAFDAILMGHERAPRLARTSLRRACQSLVYRYLGVKPQSATTR